MPAMQVQSVLECVRDLHQTLARQYVDLSSKAGNEKLKLLYTDMAGREKEFAKVVRDFERAAEDDVLTTWLQFVPDEVVDFTTDSVINGEPRSLEDTVEQLQKVGRTLGDAYHKVAGETECGHLCDLFRNLAALEANNDRHLSKLMLEE